MMSNTEETTMTVELSVIATMSCTFSALTLSSTVIVVSSVFDIIEDIMPVFVSGIDYQQILLYNQEDGIIVNAIPMDVQEICTYEQQMAAIAVQIEES